MRSVCHFLMIAPRIVFFSKPALFSELCPSWFCVVVVLPPPPLTPVKVDVCVAAAGTAEGAA